MSFIMIHKYIQRIDGTWPVLLGPPELPQKCPMIKGAETLEWGLVHS